MLPLLVLGTIMTGLLSAETLGYTLLTAEGPAPSPRVDGTIAYDSASQRVLLFGGDDGAAKNDLWAYSLASRSWQQLAPSGAAPAPRFGHTVIFDPVRRRLVLFGGQARGFFSDVWAYDVAANSWTQLAQEQAGPSRRYGHSAIYDAPRNRMVISHGFTDAGRFDDTWAFDLAANRWLTVAGAQESRCRRSEGGYRFGVDPRGTAAKSAIGGQQVLRNAHIGFSHLVILPPWFSEQRSDNRLWLRAPRR